MVGPSAINNPSISLKSYPTNIVKSAFCGILLWFSWDIGLYCITPALTANKEGRMTKVIRFFVHIGHESLLSVNYMRRKRNERSDRPSLFARALPAGGAGCATIGSKSRRERDVEATGLPYLQGPSRQGKGMCKGAKRLRKSRHFLSIHKKRPFYGRCEYKAHSGSTKQA